jgi:hypothetical protein
MELSQSSSNNVPVTRSDRLRFRFSLRTLLVACVVIGTIVAVNLRNHYLLHRFEVRESICDGYWVAACWDYPFGKPELLYVFVKIPKFGLGPNINTSLGGTWRTPPINRGLAGLPRGLFLDGEKVPRSDQGHAWTYRYATHEVVQIDVGQERCDLTPDDFNRLAQTAFWRTQVLPFIERELESNAAYVERRGPLADPGLDRQEQAQSTGAHFHP